MKPYFVDETVSLYHGDALEVLRTLPAGSVDCCVTSPPYYGLRDYGEPGQYGLEATPGEYVERMRAVFAEIHPILAPDGTLWLNLGDSYANGKIGRNDAGRDIGGRGGNRLGSGNPGGGSAVARAPGVSPKNLLGIPWRVAFALQDDGWILRNAIVWDKPNAMPESVTDRLSTTYETVFLFARSQKYLFDLDSIREPYSENKPWGSAANGIKASSAIATLRGHRADQHQTGLNRDPAGRENPLGRNPGDVWTIPTQPFPAAHFAVMAPAVARRCILAGCRPGGVVLDPFCGSGTTGMVAQRTGRRFVGIDLSAKYLNLALRTRLAQTALIDEVLS